MPDNQPMNTTKREDLAVKLNNLTALAFGFSHEYAEAEARNLVAEIDHYVDEAVIAARLSELEGFKKIPIKDMSRAVTQHVSRRARELQSKQLNTEKPE